jgi:putative glycosyltransferase (TIGR04372 family)
LYATLQLLEKLDLVNHILDPNNFVVDQHDLLARSPNFFKFSTREEEIGALMLEKLGIPQETKWVCLHIRDSAYDTWRGDYWKDSENNPANQSPSNFEAAIKFLVSRGYWVVRVGKRVHSPLSLESPHVVDYATLPWKHDLLEIYLVANCEFMISTPSGIDSVAHVWKRPMLCVNHPKWYSLRRFIPNSLHVLQNVVDVESGELISHSDLKRRLLINGGESVRTAMESDLCYVKNSSEQILEATKEMIDMVLPGRNTPYDAQDEARQEVFWSLFPKVAFYGEGTVRTRIGRAFLKDNPHWLQ